MIFYVDGDVNYKARINGINMLDESDLVIIYYNGNNEAFNNKTPKEINYFKNCKCKVKFKKVNNMSQAVDFSIAIDIARNNADELMVIIGEDKHLKTISNLLNKNNISCAMSIKEKLLDKLLEIDDITDYVEFLFKVLPKEKATKILRNQIQMFAQLEQYAITILD